MTAEQKKQMFHSLVDLAIDSNADLTTILARDDKGKLICVAALGLGADALKLGKFLKVPRFRAKKT